MKKPKVQASHLRRKSKRVSPKVKREAETSSCSQLVGVDQDTASREWGKESSILFFLLLPFIVDASPLKLRRIEWEKSFRRTKMFLYKQQDEKDDAGYARLLFSLSIRQC